MRESGLGGSSFPNGSLPYFFERNVLLIGNPCNNVSLIVVEIVEICQIEVLCHSEVHGYDF